MNPKEIRNVFLAAMATAAVTTTVWNVIADRRNKKKTQARHAAEFAFMQRISDDLHAGRVPLDAETIARLEKIVAPLRAQGLIK